MFKFFLFLAIVPIIICMAEELKRKQMLVILITLSMLSFPQITHATTHTFTGNFIENNVEYVYLEL